MVRIHCGDTTCLKDKILERSHNQNHGIVKSYVEVSGELWSQKWSGSKPPLKAPHSRAHKVSNLRVACGIPLGINPHPDPNEGLVNKRKDWWLKPQIT
jgi:hypothetical protein